MTTRSSERVAVLGSGGWGTALAVHLGRLGKDVRLWARDAALVREMAAQRVNQPYLPGVELPAGCAADRIARDRAGSRAVRRGGDPVAWDA